MQKLHKITPDGRHLFVSFGFDLDFAKRNNQAPYLSVTGEEWDGVPMRRTERNLISLGACPAFISEHFPQVAPLLPFHLCSIDGPMHYEANTIYFAGDRDHYGLRKGEFRPSEPPKWGLAVVGSADPVSVYDLRNHQHEDGPFPPPPMLEWRRIGRTGKGKARELDSARRSAIWPDATDAELCSEPEELRKLLRARLPGLLARFRATCAACGVPWPETDC